MRDTSWRAFVRFREEPEAKPEWDHEMDVEIAKAVNEVRWVCGPAYNVPEYSTDLVAVVRAADKWRKTKLHLWSICSLPIYLENCGPFAANVQEGGRYSYGPTPALALAKALLAAIRAESGKPRADAATKQEASRYVREGGMAPPPDFGRCRLCGEVHGFANCPVELRLNRTERVRG